MTSCDWKNGPLWDVEVIIDDTQSRTISSSRSIDVEQSLWRPARADERLNPVPRSLGVSPCPVLRYTGLEHISSLAEIRQDTEYEHQCQPRVGPSRHCPQEEWERCLPRRKPRHLRALPPQIAYWDRHCLCPLSPPFGLLSRG